MLPLLKEEAQATLVRKIIADYATFLATGHTLQSKSIKADTIQKYLFDAKTFIQKFDHIKRDVTIDKTTNKSCLVYL